MFVEEIPYDVKTTTQIVIRYDCDGGNDRCGKLWTLKYKDAKKNFDKNKGKHICRQCSLKKNNPAKRKDVQEKIKQTNLERYGATCALNTEENIAARVDKMFGTEESVKKIVAKRKQTNQQKYGTDHPMQNEKVKAKQQAILTEKYGSHAPLQNEEIKAKMQRTVQEKYGVANVGMLPETRKKMAKTMYEKYGVEHYNQLPEMKEYLQENCSQWLKESWENPWSKGITRPEEWNQKQRETVTNLMTIGIWKAGYPTSKKGFCFPKNRCKKEKIYFRSSYEAIYCYYLDNNSDVEWFSFEPFRIPYKFENKTRYYVPDFVIKWKDNSVVSIHELKAEFLREDEQVKAKSSCAELFALQNNMEFKILFCEDIASLGIEFDKLEKLGFISK